MWLWQLLPIPIMKYAILIDGGFAKTKLGSRDNPASAKNFTQLVEKIRQHEFLQHKYLYRVYYYDAPPYSKSHNKPLNGGKHNFAADPLTIHNQQVLKDLTLEDHFALRIGEIRFRGWELNTASLPNGVDHHTITSENLRPSLQQKGVDMRIGLDIASLSLKRQVDIIVLVTGDSDFVPPMKFARREGIQLALITFGHNVHAGLLEHADLLLDLSLPKND